MKLSCLFILFAFFTGTLPVRAAAPNSLGEEEALRPNYIQVFRQRVVTTKAQAERKRWEAEIAHNKLNSMDAANAKVPGVFSAMEVRRQQLVWDQKKAEVAAMDSRVAETENLLSLVEQSLPMGVKVPIVVEFQP